MKKGLKVWFSIGMGLATLFYVLLSFGPLLAMVFENTNSTGESYFRMVLSVCGANGLVAVFLVFKKQLKGIVWSLVPLLVGLLATQVDIGWGLIRHVDEVIGPFVVPAILLFSQIPYLNKCAGRG